MKYVIKDTDSLRKFMKVVAESGALYTEEESDDDLLGDLDAATQSDKPQDDPAAGNKEKPKGDTKPQGQSASVELGNVAAKGGETSNDENLANGNISVDMIVDKINQVRAGRSLRDQHIAEEMEKYFNDLNDAERVALYAFLKGLTQVLSGEVDGSQATEPSDEPTPNVKMQATGKPQQDNKSSQNKTRHIKPNVLKKGNTTEPKQNTAQPQQTAKQGVSNGKEDTSAPIQVKSRR